MRHRHYTMKLAPGFLLFILFLHQPAFAESEKVGCNTPFILWRMLEKYHYQPALMNDSTSRQIFDSFLEITDPHLSYFTDADIDKLLPYRDKLDDEIKKQSCTFLDLVTEMYRERLQKADALITEIAKQPFDYCANDTMFFSNTRHTDYADDEAVLKKRWSKWMKYQTLNYLYSFSEEPDKLFAKGCKDLPANEAEIRGKIALKQKQSVDRILNDANGFEFRVASFLCNAITMRFDPHTLFLSPDESEQFREALSAEAPSFGLWFKETPNGGTQIAQLVPGGPAWKSNELNEGDVVTQVQWPGNRVVDLTLSDPYEVEEMLNTSGYNLAQLTVKKTNGLTKTVQLVKEVLQSDENTINGLVLQGEKKIGYISLPSFYTEWENRTGRGCSDDVAKEILKLKTENINGLILDLRNNAGGSMEEALKLAGIFIDEGPLCIIQSRNEKPSVLKDLNRGTLYDGPLLVLVNAGSASASELLAAVLQDYRRAVIVGSPTFGKATAQSILPMDTTIIPEMIHPSMQSNSGYVVLTMSKFYRVTRASHQLEGVKPDIVLPEVFLSEIKESTLPYALAADSVKRQVVFTAQPALPNKAMAEQSSSRLSADKEFKEVMRLVDSLEATYDKGKAVPLKPEFFRKSQKEDDELDKHFEELLTHPAGSFTVSNNKFDQSLIGLDEYAKQISDVLLKATNEDIYIEEAYQIMLNLIDTK